MENISHHNLLMYARDLQDKIPEIYEDLLNPYNFCFLQKETKILQRIFCIIDLQTKTGLLYAYFVKNST